MMDETVIVIMLQPRSLTQTGIEGAPDLCHPSHYLKSLTCRWAAPKVFILPFELFSSQQSPFQLRTAMHLHDVSRKTTKDHGCVAWPIAFTLFTLLGVFVSKFARVSSLLFQFVAFNLFLIFCLIYLIYKYIYITYYN